LKTGYENLERSHDEKIKAEDQLAEKVKEHEATVSEKDGAIQQLKDEIENLKSKLEEATEHFDLLNIEMFGKHMLLSSISTFSFFLANLSILMRTDPLGYVRQVRDQYPAMICTSLPEKLCKI
jgi:hypothetical protein